MEENVKIISQSKLEYYPIDANVLVERLEVDIDGVITPDVLEESDHYGRVIAVGGEVKHLSVGDQVVYRRGVTRYLKYASHLGVLNERDIMAKIKIAD